MDINTINDVLRVAAFTPGMNGRWGIPVLFEADPGVGKTSVINAWAKRHGIMSETMLGSIREPADFMGVPVPTNNHLEYKVGGVVYRIAKHTGPALIFLDELNHSPPAVLAAMLRLVLEGVAGDIELGPRVRFIAAQNPAGQVGAHDLSVALINRWCIVPWPALQPSEWNDYMLSTGVEEEVEPIDPEALEAKIEKAFPAAFARASAAVGTFLKSRPSLLSRVPKPHTPDAGKPFPTPRSWEMAVRLLAGARVHGVDGEVRELLIEGCIGAAATNEMLGWFDQQDLPNPEDVLDGNVKFVHNPSRLDRTEAVLAACASLVAPEGAERRAKRADVLFDLLLDVSNKNGQDLVVPAVRMLHKSKGLLSSKKATDLLSGIHEVFHAAQ